MAVQQGRRRIETGGGTDRTSWGRSPVQWILANGKTPPVFLASENLNRYVEDFDEPRTKLAAILSILLKEPLRAEKVRPRRSRVRNPQTDAPFPGVIEVLLIE